jgi:hypothetical protein
MSMLLLLSLLDSLKKKAEYIETALFSFLLSFVWYNASLSIKHLNLFLLGEWSNETFGVILLDDGGAGLI